MLAKEWSTAQVEKARTKHEKAVAAFKEADERCEEIQGEVMSESCAKEDRIDALSEELEKVKGEAVAVLREFIQRLERERDKSDSQGSDQIDRAMDEVAGLKKVREEAAEELAVAERVHACILEIYENGAQESYGLDLGAQS